MDEIKLLIRVFKEVPDPNLGLTRSRMRWGMPPGLMMCMILGQIPL
jgi:hypothetical protein